MPVQVYYRMAISRDLPDVFLVIRLGLHIIQRKSSREVPSYLSHLGCILWTWLITVCVDLDHLAWLPTICHILPQSPLLSPFPYWSLWKAGTPSSLQVGDGGLTKYWHKLFGILSQGRLVSNPYLLIQSFFFFFNQCRLTHIYFILWIIIRCYFIVLFMLFQLWPLGALSVGSCVPLT